MRPEELQREPVVSQDRLEQVVHAIESEYGAQRIENWDFVSFIQEGTYMPVKTPAGILTETWIDPMAVFCVLTDNPKRYKSLGEYNPKIMTHGTALLQTILDDEKQLAHFAGYPDSVLNIYRLVCKRHLETIENLEQMN